MIFDYYKKPVRFRISEKREDDGLIKYVISFPSKVRAAFPENNSVYVLCWKAKAKKARHKTKAPAIICLHSRGEQEGGHTTEIAKTLAREGFETFLLNLPYHMRRTLKGKISGTGFLSTSYEQCFNSFKQSIIDLRCLIDIIEQLPDVDGKRIGIFGLSLGAVMAHTAMGADLRLKAGVAICGCGNLARFVARSIVGLPIMAAGLLIYLLSPRKRRKGWSKYFFRLESQYKSYLKQVFKVRDVDKVKPTMRWYLLDPLTYSYLNRPRHVLMIQGKFDIVMPKGCIIDLWNALGKPKIIWLLTSHFTSLFFKKSIIKEIINYLKTEL